MGEGQIFFLRIFMIYRVVFLTSEGSGHRILQNPLTSYMPVSLTQSTDIFVICRLSHILGLNAITRLMD